MIATDSGVADAFILIGIILIAACVACCALALTQKHEADPARTASSFPYAGYAALLGWAGVGFGWLGSLIT